MNRANLLVLYMALVVSTVIVSAVLVTMGQLDTAPMLSQSSAELNYLSLGLLVVVLAVAWLSGSRTRPLDRGEDIAAWWIGEGRKVVLVWAVANIAGTLGSFFWMVSGGATVGSYTLWLAAAAVFGRYRPAVFLSSR